MLEDAWLAERKEAEELRFMGTSALFGPRWPLPVPPCCESVEDDSALRFVRTKV